MAKKLSEYIQPSPRQWEAFRHIGSGKMVFYGGARGGGKSWLALAAAVWACLKHPGIVVTAIRETYPELYDVFISKLPVLFPENVFNYYYREKYKEAIFSNGSRLVFRSVGSVKDAKKIQGTEAQFMIIDEAPNFHLDVLRLLWGSVRKSDILKEFESTILMTGNPGGISDHWFKTHFVDINYTFWTPQEMEQGLSFVFVPAKLWDNTHIDQEAYASRLMLQGDAKRRAWLEGDWDVFEGQFFEEWSPEVHIIDPFMIPQDWQRVIGLDLGYTESHPTVAEWVAQDPITFDLYVYQEYAAWGVVEQYITDMKALIEDNVNYVIFGDPSMFDRSRRNNWSDESPANMFLREGLPIIPANNDRINGWRMLKQWMHWSPNRPPKLKIFSTCEQLIRTLPTLRYNSTMRTDVKREDLDTKMADDAVDALRYAVVSAFGFPSIAGMEGLSPSSQVLVEENMLAVAQSNPSVDYDENESARRLLKPKLRRSYYAQY